MEKKYIAVGASLMALGVILDAYASHGLSAIAGYSIVSAFKTGVTYQYYHAIAFIVLGLTAERLFSKLIPVILTALYIGLALFCANMYLVTFCRVYEWDMVLHSVQFLLPVGAVSFVIAWILYIIALFVDNKSQSEDIEF